MSQSCSRCGSTIHPGTTQCGVCGAIAGAPAGSSDSWGGLDVSRGAANPTVAQTDASPGGARQAMPTVQGVPAGMAAQQQAAPPALVAPPALAAPVIQTAAQPPQLVAPANSPGMLPGATPATGGAPDGLNIGHDPFSDSLGGMGEASAAIELQSMRPVQKRTKPRVDPAVALAEKAAGLAAFGDHGANALDALKYTARVLWRQQALKKLLAEVTVECVRARSATAAARSAMGEALYKGRKDTRLQPLADQIRAVSESFQTLSAAKEAGSSAEADAQGSVDGLSRQLAELERTIAPVRDQEATLLTKVDGYKNEVGRREAMIKRIDIELRNQQQNPQTADPARAEQLNEERITLQGEIQSLQVRLMPMEEDLGGVRRELAKHMGTSTALQEERQLALDAMERVQQESRATTGSAQEVQDKLLGELADAAFEQKLGGLVPEKAKKTHALKKDLIGKEGKLQVHEAALKAYNPGAFKQGLMALGGGVALLLAGLVALVLR